MCSRTRTIIVKVALTSRPPSACRVASIQIPEGNIEGTGRLTRGACNIPETVKVTQVVDSLQQLAVSVGPGRAAEEPAVDEQRLAGDEVGILTDEESDGARDIVGRADAAEGRSRGPRAGVVVALAACALDFYSARRDAVHGDPPGRQLHGRDFCEHLDTALAGGVVYELWKGDAVAA